MAGGSRAVAASRAILQLSWDHPHRRHPLSKTGFRRHSQRLHGHPPSTARRHEVPTAGLCKRQPHYLVSGLAKSGELFFTANGHALGLPVIRRNAGCSI